MARFARMDEEGRRSGGGQRRGDLAADMTALLDSCFMLAVSMTSMEEPMGTSGKLEFAHQSFPAAA